MKKFYLVFHEFNPLNLVWLQATGDVAFYAAPGGK